MSSFGSGFTNTFRLGGAVQDRFQRSSERRSDQYENEFANKQEYYLNSFTNPETGEFYSASDIASDPELGARAKEFMNEPHVNNTFFGGRKFLDMIPTDRGTHMMAVAGDDGRPAPVTATGATASENPDDPVLEGTPEQMERLWGRMLDKTFSRVNSADRLLTAVDGEQQRVTRDAHGGDNFASTRAEMAEILTGPADATATAAPDYKPQVAALGQAATQVRPEREALYNAVQTAESNNESSAVSPKGATGLMQIMPEEMAVDPGYGVANVFDRADEAGHFYGERTPEAAKELLLRHPELNQQMGREYLDAMIEEHGGDVRTGLAAYNWGPGNVKKHLAEYGELKVNRLPKETRQYIDRIERRLGHTGDTAREQVMATRDAALGRPEQAPTAHQIYSNVDLLPRRGTDEGMEFLMDDNPSEGWLKKVTEAVGRRSAQLGEARASIRNAPAAEPASTDAGVTQQVAATTDRPQQEVVQQLSQPVQETDDQVMQDTYAAETTRFQSGGRAPTGRQLEASINAIYQQPTSKNYIRALSIATAQGLITPVQGIELMGVGKKYAANAIEAQASYDKLRAEEVKAYAAAQKSQGDARDATVDRMRDDREHRVEVEGEAREALRTMFTDAIPQAMVGAGAGLRTDNKGKLQEQLLHGMTPDGLVDAMYNTASQYPSQMMSDYGVDLRAITERGYITPDERQRLNFFVRTTTNTWRSVGGDGTRSSNVSTFASPASTRYRDRNGGEVTLEEARLGFAREHGDLTLPEVDALLRKEGIHPVELN